MTPGQEAVAAVREQLRDVRVWLGETSPEHETYQPRHAKEPTC